MSSRPQAGQGARARSFDVGVSPTGLPFPRREPGFFEDRSPSVDEHGEICVAIDGVECFKRGFDSCRCGVEIDGPRCGSPVRSRGGRARISSSATQRLAKHIERRVQRDPQPRASWRCVLAGRLHEGCRVA